MNNKILSALKDAFPYTIPIMLGYLLMGMAFGILLEKSGFGVIYAFFMSVFIYAGSMQFVAVGLLASHVDLWAVLIISLVVNARQIFYGIAMLEKFSIMGKKLPYMIHSLTDETFALLNLKKPKKETSPSLFMFFISLLNHIYWITGSVIGSLIAEKLKFNTLGIDFIMTAIFIVIFIEQWKNLPNHIPAIIGILSSIVCLIIFGANNFLLPSLILITLILSILKNRLE